MLLLSLTKDTYEQLGVQGKASAYQPGMRFSELIYRYSMLSEVLKNVSSCHVGGLMFLFGYWQTNKEVIFSKTSVCQNLCFVLE